MSQSGEKKKSQRIVDTVLLHGFGMTVSVSVSVCTLEREVVGSGELR